MSQELEPRANILVRQAKPWRGAYPHGREVVEFSAFGRMEAALRAIPAIRRRIRLVSRAA